MALKHVKRTLKSTVSFGLVDDNTLTNQALLKQIRETGVVISPS
ncbi:hypothetical protein [Marinomonas algicola]|nr:hypothetical protein [Marinomonas algicola]